MLLSHHDAVSPGVTTGIPGLNTSHDPQGCVVFTAIQVVTKGVGVLSLISYEDCVDYSRDIAPWVVKDTGADQQKSADQCDTVVHDKIIFPTTPSC